ncbi:MAG: hypothetical protein IT305_06575 [Chloroflexi bacterium]|nr:hypothetical protein [Chloroflexota bacterium]
MPYLTPYHLGEQNAYALLGPVAATLRELESRTLHYVERITLGASDREAVFTAHRALAAVREEIERLHKEAAPAAAPATTATPATTAVPATTAAPATTTAPAIE